jgi:hypothetical protein
VRTFIELRRTGDGSPVYVATSNVITIEPWSGGTRLGLTSGEWVDVQEPYDDLLTYIRNAAMR